MIDFHSQLEEQFPGKNYIPTVYNSAELQDNLEHSGGITISWNAATDDEIPLGAYVKYPLPAADQTEAEAGTLRYILLDPYAPSKESAIPHYQYQPQFKHPQNMLDRIPFWIKSLDASGSPINLKTTSYTGFPYIIAQKLCDFINSEYVTETGDSFFAATIGNTWTYEIPRTIINNVVQPSKVIITVSFDGCSIKSAANAIADAMGCNVYWDWKAKKIRFVVGSTIQGETYNCFHVLGGTTNMGKTLVSGGFAAVTQRLTLPYDPEHPTAEGSYPGSIISRATSGGIRLTTDLIFDDIYPKQELYIKSARQRLCYLTDENGEFIVDHWEKDGQIVEEGTDGATPVYKTFAKWYVTFKNADGTDYDFDPSLLIQDQPLGLLFQIDYDHPQVMSALVGQQFELTYYPTRQKEHDRNDVSSEFIVEAGEFFIAVKAVGNVILPYTMNSQAKGTVDMAYSTLPPASAEYDGQTAIVSNQNRIYSCILNPGDDEYEWGVLKTVSGGDIYIVNHGNLDGTYTSPDTLNGTAIIWNATGNKWDVYGNMLFPCVGDKVTLVNMALSPEQISDAKDELLAAANEIIYAMTTPSGEYQETIVLNKSHYNTGGIITSVSVGEETIFERDVEAQDRKHGPVVTQIQQNIDTGIVQVTVGSWTRKTKTGGTVDKLETVSVSSSSPTNGGDSLGDGTFGPGGGYSGGGSSSTEQNTINQTVLKPDSLFLATLGNTIDAVSCDSEGKVRIESDIYSYITGKYGTKDVTTSCEVSVTSLPPVQPTQTAGQNLEVEIYVTDRNGDETRITQLNTAYELTDEKRWLRFHFPVGYDMAYEKDGVKVLDDSLTQLFSIGHPAFTDRGLSMTIQAMREGAEGIGGAFKSRVFRRTNTDISNTRPTGGTYASPYPTDEDSDHHLLWSDGIPQGEEKLWSSVATFEPNTTNPTWSLPSQETDTMTLDIEFAAQQANDATPQPPDETNRHKEAYPYGYDGQVWFDPDLDKYSAAGVLRDFTNMYWRAEREKKNGAWGDWSITLIKGEKGENAVKRWLQIGPTQVEVDSNGETLADIDPENVYVEAWMQEEGGTPRKLTYDEYDEDFLIGGTIKGRSGTYIEDDDVCLTDRDYFDWNTTTNRWELKDADPSNPGPIEAGSTFNYLYFIWNNGNSGAQYDRKDVEVLRSGKDVVRLALDNEHEDFLYTEGGTEPIAPSGGAKAKIQLYRGGTDISSVMLSTSTLTISSTTGVPTTGDKVPYIDYSTKTLIVPHITANTAEVVVRAIYKNTAYYAKFTGNKTLQDKYDMVFNENSSIAYNPDSYSTKTIKVYANRTDKCNNTSVATIDTSTITDLAAGMLRLFAKYNNGTSLGTRQITTSEIEGGIAKLKLDVDGTIASINDGIYFELRKYTGKIVSATGMYEYNVVDFETVEIAKSENGSDGDDAQYEISEYGRSTSRENYGTGYIDTSVGRSSYDNTEGWISNTVTPEGNYKYIWKRTHVYDPNNDSYSNWVYVSQTGDQGPSGIGEDAVVWSLEAAPQVIDYGLNFAGTVDSFSPSSFLLKAKKTEGNTTTEYTSGSLPSGLSISYKRSDQSGETSGVTVGTKTSSSYLQNNNSQPVPYVDFFLKQNGTTISTFRVSSNRVYQRMLIPAGEWDSNKTYSVTDTTIPLVLYVINSSKKYYYLDAAAGTATSSDVPGTSTKWREANQFEVILVEMLMANFGKIDEFVFYGGWMFSQSGMIRGAASTDYGQFDPTTFKNYMNGTTSTYSGFIPNFAVDGLSGITYQNSAHVRGEVHASSGTIGGFKINSNTITDDNTTPMFSLDSTNKKMIVGDVEIRSDQPTGENYTWSGMASKSSFGDSVAIGMRKYTSGTYNGTYGGHFSMQGNGSEGGALDIKTGGDITNCLFKMGLIRDVNTSEVIDRIYMQAGATNDYLESAQASIEVKSLADTTKSTKITPSSINTPQVTTPNVSGTTVSASTLNVSNIASLKSGVVVNITRIQNAYTIQLTDYVIINTTSSTLAVTLPQQPADGQMYIIIPYSTITLQCGNANHKIFPMDGGEVISKSLSGRKQHYVIYDDANKYWWVSWGG